MRTEVAWIVYLAYTLGLRYALGEAIVTAPARYVAVRMLALPYPRLARWLFAMLRCPACFGFWVGLATSPLFPAPTSTATVLGSGLLSMVLGRAWARLMGPTASPLDDALEALLYHPPTDTSAEEDAHGFEAPPVEGEGESEGHDG